MENQAYIFLIFILSGIIIGVLFDIFRVLRRSFKTSNFLTYLEDILFWIITLFIMLYFIFKFNNGELRLFMFLGTGLGCLFYILTISKIFIKINVFIINIFKKIITNIIIVPLKAIFKFLSKPIKFIFINLRRFLSYFRIKNIKINKLIKKRNI